MDLQTQSSSAALHCGGSADLGPGFWNERYTSRQTGWDLGEVSPPLQAYIDQIENKNLRILIPGCGNSYEAAYLLSKGFTDITLIDIAPALVRELQQKFGNNPNIEIIEGNFFDLKTEFDLILEQTFFCAIDPDLRTAYVKKMHELLAPGGKLAGVLFDRDFDKPGPPFGGDKKEYEALFRPYFYFTAFDTCYNSAKPRQGTELFIDLTKK